MQVIQGLRQSGLGWRVSSARLHWASAGFGSENIRIKAEVANWQQYPKCYSVLVALSRPSTLPSAGIGYHMSGKSLVGAASPQEAPELSPFDVYPGVLIHP